MPQFVILYHERTQRPADPPLACIRTAAYSDDAEEAFLREYPGADVVWIVHTASVADALHDYLAAGETT